LEVGSVFENVLAQINVRCSIGKFKFKRFLIGEDHRGSKGGRFSTFLILIHILEFQGIVSSFGGNVGKTSRVFSIEIISPELPTKIQIVRFVQESNFVPSGKRKCKIERWNRRKSFYNILPPYVESSDSPVRVDEDATVVTLLMETARLASRVASHWADASKLYCSPDFLKSEIATIFLPVGIQVASILKLLDPFP